MPSNLHVPFCLPFCNHLCFLILASFPYTFSLHSLSVSSFDQLIMFLTFFICALYTTIFCECIFICLHSFSYFIISFHFSPCFYFFLFSFICLSSSTQLHLSLKLLCTFIFLYYSDVSFFIILIFASVFLF
jgi:hypothetical protein